MFMTIEEWYVISYVCLGRVYVEHWTSSELVHLADHMIDVCV